MDAAAHWVRENGGRAAFEDFMEAALFDPEIGYYSRNIRAIGRTGDFTTSPMLDAWFALPKAVAAWLRMAISDDGLPWNIIELGGGDGAMADAVLSVLGWWKRRRVRYHLVDRSEPLVGLQKEKLRGYRCVRWHSEVCDALEACGGEAVVFSNELADAFPAMVFQCDAKERQWRKLHLAVDEGARIRFEFSPVPPGELPRSSVFNPAHAWPDGQIVEIHRSYHDWMQTWIPMLKRGHLLTIDYGDHCPQLYHRRPNGTLRGFFHHTRSASYTGVLRRMGHMDITADVNFTDLTEWGEEAGLRTVKSQTQEAFAREMAIPSARSEAAEAFKVLWQRREAVPSFP